MISRVGKDEMHIVYSSSDYYADCTGVSIYSLYDSNPHENINVYVLSSGISEINKNRLHDLAKKFNRKLTIIDADEGLLEAAKEYGFEKLRGSYNTYSRIILNKWLSFLEKVIVIDSDTLITGSIRDMWDIDIADYYYAAVPEVSMYGKYNYFEDEDIVYKNDIYFNAGICTVNLKKWRENNIDKWLLDQVKKDSQRYLNSEQSIMNKFLGNKIKRIPLKYNFYTTYHFASLGIINRTFYKKQIIDDSEYIEAKSNPVIIHYCGFSYERPWFNHSVAYKKNYYMEIRNKTPWGTERLRKWGYRESKFKYLYDGVCYLLLRLKMYNICLLFRLVFAQRVKGFLHR